MSSFPLTATSRTIALSSETREPRTCALSCGFSESVLRFTYECRAYCRGFARLTIPADISHDDADRFLPAVGLVRIRELVDRYPDFNAEPDIGVLEVTH
jgi:hypothetical protein